MTVKKFIIALLITLFVTNTIGCIVQIQTMRTDISLLQDQNSILTNEVELLKVEIGQIESRLRYTALVTDLEPMLKSVEVNQRITDSMVAKYKTLDEIMKQMFGR